MLKRWTLSIELFCLLRRNEIVCSFKCLGLYGFGPSLIFFKIVYRSSWFTRQNSKLNFLAERSLFNPNYALEYTKGGLRPFKNRNSTNLLTY
jgi:hypothetical protein